VVCPNAFLRVGIFTGDENTFERAEFAIIDRWLRRAGRENAGFRWLAGGQNDGEF